VGVNWRSEGNRHSRGAGARGGARETKERRGKSEYIRNYLVNNMSIYQWLARAEPLLQAKHDPTRRARAIVYGPNKPVIL
jgi:hypothetical protein